MPGPKTVERSRSHSPLGVVIRDAGLGWREIGTELTIVEWADLGTQVYGEVAFGKGGLHGAVVAAGIGGSVCRVRSDDRSAS